MSKRRTHTVQIEGIGPVTIRGLTKRQMTRIATRHRGEEARAVVRAGLIEPKPSEVYGTDADLDTLINLIATEITERSWPKVKI